MKNEPASYGFPYGYYGTLTGGCNAETQGSSGLEGPIMEITVIFHIRPSKGDNPSLYMAPLYICVCLSWGKSVISVRRPSRSITMLVLPLHLGRKNAVREA